VKSFIKDETYLPPKAVRLINSRDDFFKCLSGPLFDAISHELFKVTEKNSWFIKNVPVADRPEVIMKKMMRDGKTYYCTDYTAFECHFTPDVMKTIEFGLYDSMVRRLSAEERRRMQLIKDVLSGENVCYFSQGRVKVHGTRMSGEMNTSLGNGFSNLMLTLFIADQKRCGEVLGFVEGDDGLFTFEHEDRAPTVEDYKQLGFTIKMEKTRNLNEASFCGNVFDTTDKVVLTDPMAALAGFGWTNKKYVNANRNTQLALLRAKALSLVHQYNGVPMLMEFGRRVEELTRGVTISKRIINNTEQYHRQRLKSYVETALPIKREVTMQTRALVEKLYLVSVEAQIAFEQKMPELQLDSTIELHGFPIVPFTDWYFESYSFPLKTASRDSQALNRPFGKTWDYIDTRYPGLRPRTARCA
jgi:hypothetical protein